MPKTTYVDAEVAENLLRPANLADPSSVSQLVERLHDPTFDLVTFKMIVKSVKHCEEVSCKTKKRSIKDDIFRRILVMDGGSKDEG